MAEIFGFRFEDYILEVLLTKEKPELLLTKAYKALYWKLMIAVCNQPGSIRIWKITSVNQQ
jgi:hypothetical protein